MAERSDQVVGLFSPSDIKGDHGTEAVCEQAPGQVVVGMRGKPGINDPRHFGMGFEAGRQFECRRAGAVRAQAQGRQAAQRQPAFERVARLSKRRGDGPDPVNRLTRADHHAQGQVAVAADQLCHRMHDEGRPQLDRPAQ